MSAAMWGSGGGTGLLRKLLTARPLEFVKHLPWEAERDRLSWRLYSWGKLNLDAVPHLNPLLTNGKDHRQQSLSIGLSQRRSWIDFAPDGGLVAL